MPAGVYEHRMSAPRPEAGAAQSQADQFVAVHMKRVFLLVYRIVGNVADAQDLTQEVFIKVLQRQEQLRDPEKASHWLSRIATNTAIDFLRRHNRVNFSQFDEVAPMAMPDSENPEHLVLRAENQIRLEAGLAILTERERTAIVLRDVEDMPAEEVAKQLNCSKATVRSHIANARTKFKRFLERKKE